MNETKGTRLDAIMSERGVENAQLAEAAQVTRQQIFKLRTGVTRVSPEWARRLAPHLGVTPAGLLGLSDAEGAFGADHLKPPPPRAPPNQAITISELDVRAMGGAGSEDMSLDGDGNHVVLAEWTVPHDYLRSYTPSPSATRIIRVVGDSMEPHYPAGDRVLIDTAHVVPSPPGVYVIWDGLGLVLKHVEVLAGRMPLIARLSSDNPAYAPYEVPVADLRVQGRVMGKWVWK